MEKFTIEFYETADGKCPVKEFLDDISDNKLASTVVRDMKLDEYISERCAKDPKFQYEYDALEIEYQLKQAVVEMRKTKNLTQKELAELTGIHQADISKIENCNANPSLSTIRRLAKGLGKKLKIEFVDYDVVGSHPIYVAET